MNQSKDILIQLLMQLEGVGQKTAERFANQIVQKQNQEILNDLAGCLTKLSFCPLCNNVNEQNECSNCKKIEQSKTICITLHQNQDTISGQFPIEKLINPLKNNYPQASWLMQLDQLIKLFRVENIIFDLPKNLSANLTIEFIKAEINQPNLFKEQK